MEGGVDVGGHAGPILFRRGAMQRGDHDGTHAMGQGIGRLPILLLALLQQAGCAAGCAGVTHEQGMVTLRMGLPQPSLVPPCQGQPASFPLESTRQGAAKPAGGAGDQDVTVIGHGS
jgi:hypothetical protein